jgi:hypothetical protein
MDFSLRDIVPEGAFDKAGKFSLDRYMENARRCNALAEQIAGTKDVSVVQHRVLLLVDLQGVYLALVGWLKERGFALESGLIISRFTIFLLESVIDSITSDVIAEVGAGAISFEKLVQLVSKKQSEQINSTKCVVKLEPAIELFYAPAPLDRIAWHLRKEAKNGSFAAQQQLARVREGVIQLHGEERDYRFYEDFVENLKHDPLVTRSERGFVNFFVGPKGLQFFDEKEVDIKVAIRAVDACAENEVESVCIVSSDQDFIPLHERCGRSGVRTYQADVAKFAKPKNVGRKIKELGADFIPTGVDPEWPLKAILEAFAPFAIYRISMEEFEGLCRLHNGLNEVQLSPHPLEGGGMGIRMHRPL